MQLKDSLIESALAAYLLFFPILVPRYLLHFGVVVVALLRQGVDRSLKKRVITEWENRRKIENHNDDKKRLDRNDELRGPVSMCG